MEQESLISIIVPVYGVEPYLDACVKSLTGQTYRNVEILLVDDGSPDRCPQLCDEWAARDSRVRALHKPNGGLSDARNAGLDAARGAYVMFVDSDDFVDAHIVADLYALLRQTGADVACGGIFKYGGGKPIPVYNPIIRTEAITYTGVEQLRHLLDSQVDCSACGKLYTRAAIGSLRFIKGRYNEDVIFLFELYGACLRVACTQRRYYYYRDTAGSVTHTLSERTMHALRNAREMAQMAREKDLPVKAEMDNYLCRTCLELAYSIWRAGARRRFPREAAYCRSHVRHHLGYMLRHPGYGWRDLVHALIVLTQPRLPKKK